MSIGLHSINLILGTYYFRIPYIIGFRSLMVFILEYDPGSPRSFTMRREYQFAFQD